MIDFLRLMQESNVYRSEEMKLNSSVLKKDSRGWCDRYVSSPVDLYDDDNDNPNEIGIDSDGEEKTNQD